MTLWSEYANNEPRSHADSDGWSRAGRGDDYSYPDYFEILWLNRCQQGRTLLKAHQPRLSIVAGRSMIETFGRCCCDQKPYQSWVHELDWCILAMTHLMTSPCKPLHRSWRRSSLSESQVTAQLLLDISCISIYLTRFCHQANWSPSNRAYFKNFLIKPLSESAAIPEFVSTANGSSCRRPSFDISDSKTLSCTFLTGCQEASKEQTQQDHPLIMQPLTWWPLFNPFYVHGSARTQIRIFFDICFAFLIWKSCEYSDANFISVEEECDYILRIIWGFI